MIVSTKGRYALRVMVELAQHQGDGYVPLNVIAERQDISEKYLESILKVLVQDKLLTGLRGAKTTLFKILAGEMEPDEDGKKSWILHAEML